MILKFYSKILTFLGTLFSVITLLFFLFSLLGNPAETLLGQRTDKQLIEKLSEKLGWNKSLPERYFLFLKNLSPVSFEQGVSLKTPYFGDSFHYKKDAMELYLEHLVGTLLLAIPSITFAFLLGILLGSLSAYWEGSYFSRSFDFISSLGIALPSFFVGVLAIKLFAVDFGNFPVSGFVLQPDVEDASAYVFHREYFFLPFITLAFRPFTILYQLQKQSLSDVLKSDYIRTARAKGLPERIVVFKHGFRNALNPVFTSATNWLASLLGGTFFIEYIFQWKGIGNLLVNGLLTRDYPVVLVSCVMTSVIFVGILFLTDLGYVLIDPRLRK